MRAKIDELLPQTLVTVAFLYTILCIITHTTQKLKVVLGSFTYQRVMVSNMHCNHSPVCHLVRNYTLNLKNTGHMWTFYISNDCCSYSSCLFSLSELDVWYEWQVTCMPPNMHQSLFLITHFGVYSVLRHIAWKFQVICGRSAYRTTAILSEMFFVWFGVTLGIQLKSYNPRHASVVSDTTLCAYTVNPYI